MMTTMRRGIQQVPALAVLALALAGAIVAGSSIGSAAKLDVASEHLTGFDGPTEVTLSTCTITASADTYVDESAPLTPAGGATMVKVRSQQSANQRALVRFDLSGCSIPRNASVRGARLDLYVAIAPTTNRSYSAHAAAAPWDEITTAWSNQPAASSVATSVVTTGTTAGTTLSWDVASDVAAFVSGATTNNGWLIADQSEGAAAPGVGAEFTAREDASGAPHPTLVVSYYP